MFNNYIIVIGASAGGLEALSNLLRPLPKDFPGAIFIVNHLQSFFSSNLPFILDRVTALPVASPLKDVEIKSGKVLVAPPDQHLLIDKERALVKHGPKVNHSRPAIDPLFRSAAVSYGPRVIGIVLSGMLDDGTAGLLSIKKRGGVTIVQDLTEAQYPDMPRNAFNNVPIDYCLPTSDIARTLIELVQRPVPADMPLASTLLEEESKMNMTMNSIPEEDMNKLGKPSVFTCPACHGTLWEIEEEKILRYRCRVGHAYGLESLSASLGENVEDALWAALRALKEKAQLADRIAQRAAQENPHTASFFERRAHLAKLHSEMVRDILLGDQVTEKDNHS